MNYEINKRNEDWADAAVPFSTLAHEFETAAPVPDGAREMWASGQHEGRVEAHYLGWWPSAATFAQDLAVGLGIALDGPNAWHSFVDAVSDEYVVTSETGGGVFVFEDPRRVVDASGQRISPNRRAP